MRLSISSSAQCSKAVDIITHSDYNSHTCLAAKCARAGSPSQSTAAHSLLSVTTTPPTQSPHPTTTAPAIHCNAAKPQIQTPQGHCCVTAVPRVGSGTHQPHPLGPLGVASCPAAACQAACTAHTAAAEPVAVCMQPGCRNPDGTLDRVGVAWEGTAADRSCRHLRYQHSKES